MRVITALFFMVIAFVMFAACASMWIGTQEWFNQHRAGKKTLAERASFDLSCAVDGLKFVCVGSGSDCSSVGVSGCEKKAVYVFVAGKWVMNSDSQPAGK